MLTINEVLQQERYRIIKQLDTDTTGSTYEAYDNNLETNVILKEINVNLGKVATISQIDKRRVAFASEAKILTEIKHQSLLQVQGYFSEIDRQYLVLESVGGDNLLEWLSRQKLPMAITDFVSCADQLIDVIHCLHTRTPPVIHCDINPQNIKLAPNGKIKLLALDIAKKPEERENAIIKNQASSSDSLHYLPLEQIWGGLNQASKKVILNNYEEESERILEQPVDARSDIYALGATLYHLATMRIPVDALERSIDILEGKTDPLIAPNKINPTIPPEISDVLMKALEIKREHRFSSAAIMRQFLRVAVNRANERQAAETNRQEIAARERNLAQQKVLEQERQLAEQKKAAMEQQAAEQKRSEIEAEQKQRIEAIEKQLREAEERRLEAEERAAAAEKLLQERENQKDIPNEVIVLDGKDLLEEETGIELTNLNKEVIPEIPAEIIEDVSPAVFLQNESAEAEKPDLVEKESIDDTKEMFVLPENGNKNFKRILLAAIALLIIGGAATWGILNYSTPTNTPAPVQAISNPPVSASEATKPEPAVQSESQTLTEQNSANSSTPEISDPLVNSSEIKNKPPGQQPAAKTKKPGIQPAKTSPAQKKTVTVEDIINDN